MQGAVAPCARSSRARLLLAKTVIRTYLSNRSMLLQELHCRKAGVELALIVSSSLIVAIASPFGLILALLESHLTLLPTRN